MLSQFDVYVLPLCFTASFILSKLLWLLTFFLWQPEKWLLLLYNFMFNTVILHLAFTWHAITHRMHVKTHDAHHSISFIICDECHINNANRWNCFRLSLLEIIDRECLQIFMVNGLMFERHRKENFCENRAICWEWVNAKKREIATIDGQMDNKYIQWCTWMRCDILVAVHRVCHIPNYNFSSTSFIFHISLFFSHISAAVRHSLLCMA